MKLTTRCGSAAVDGLNEALLAKAAEAKLLRTTRVRADTTVVPANVAYPTDSGLLAKAVRRIAATGQADPGRRRRGPHPGAGPVPGGRASGRTRSAAKLRLARRGRAATRRRPRSARVTGELADLAETAADEAEQLLVNARRALRRAQAKAAELARTGEPDAAAGRRRGRLARAVNDLTELLDATRQIAAQTRQRLAGQIPDGATRRVSLHDPRCPPDRQGPTRASRSSSATRPRSSTTTTASCSTTPSSRATRRRTRNSRPRSQRVIQRTGRRRAPSPPTAATASNASRTTCTTSASAPWSSPARADPAQARQPTNTDQRSAEP